MISESAARKIRNAAVLLLKFAAVIIGASGQAAHGADLAAPLDQAVGGGSPSAVVDVPLPGGSQADGENVLPAQPSGPETPAVQKVVMVEPEQPVPGAESPAPQSGAVPSTATAEVEVPAAPLAAPSAKTPDVPKEPEAAVEQEVAPAPEVAVQEEPELGTRYSLAPIKWGGSASESFGWMRLKTPENGSSTLIENLQAINVRAVTYIFQPWLATVRGDVGVVNGTANNIGIYGGETHTTSTNLTGGGGVVGAGAEPLSVRGCVQGQR